MPDELVLAIDQGTSSTKCLLVDRAGAVVRTASAPVPIRYPRPGWVEQDADRDPRQRARPPRRNASTGAARRGDRGRSQHPTRVGGGLGPAHRPAGRAGAGLAGPARRRPLRRPAGQGPGRTGSARSAASRSTRCSAPPSCGGCSIDAPDAAVGTVDAWLLYALTGSHQIEVGNASRTQLLDVRRRRRGAPNCSSCSASRQRRCRWSRRRPGRWAGSASAGESWPGCRSRRCSATRMRPFTRTAPRPTRRQGHLRHRLVGHAARPARRRRGLPDRRLERPPRRGGQHPLQRVDRRLAGRIARHLARTDRADGRRTPSSDGVHLVPAFGGLAAPWWDDTAVGLISGLTLGTRPAQLARAAARVDRPPGRRRRRRDGRRRPAAGRRRGERQRPAHADPGRPGRRTRETGPHRQPLRARRRLPGRRRSPTPIPRYDDFDPGPGDPAVPRSAWRDAVARARTPIDGSNPT